MIVEMDPCSRVPNCNNLYIPGVLRKRNFLVGAGLRGIVNKVCTWDGTNFIAEVGECRNEF